MPSQTKVWKFGNFHKWLRKAKTIENRSDGVEFPFIGLKWIITSWQARLIVVRGRNWCIYARHYARVFGTWECDDDDDRAWFMRRLTRIILVGVKFICEYVLGTSYIFIVIEYSEVGFFFFEKKKRYASVVLFRVGWSLYRYFIPSSLTLFCLFGCLLEFHNEIVYDRAQYRIFARAKKLLNWRGC